METKRKRRRIMHSFRLDEVSAVDRPAQQGALVSIMKRRPSTPAAVLRYRTDEGMCTEYLTLGDLLEELHDAAPNAEKSAVAALIAKQEGGEAPEAMAREMLDRATAQLDRMVEGFMEASGADRDAAREAVEGSRVGRRIAALIGAAERMLSDDEDAEDREARRRAEMTRMSASVGGPGPARKSHLTALDARDATDDELDRMAKARAEGTGEDFLTAYEAVCGTVEGLALLRKRDGFHAMATGTAEHGRTVDLTKRDFDEDREVRNSDMYKAAQANCDSASAERALLKRAKEIQVERRDPRLSLLGALDLAKAEMPGLAKAARI
jgi:hypothetical protein